MSGASYASHLLSREHIHILGVSEHWLNNSNLHFLSSIHKDYLPYGIIDSEVRKRGSNIGKGGVAILWHKSLSNFITPLDIDSDRICGIQYRLCENMYIYFIQVYAPCSNYPIPLYRDFIDCLQTVISMFSQHGIVIVMGDLNAHLQGQRFIKATDSRGEYLLEMMNYFNLVSVNSLPITVGATASFVSYGGQYESLIDHILLPVERIDTVAYCKILDDHVLNVSRHRPIICNVHVPLTDFSDTKLPSHVAWHKIDDVVLMRYGSELGNSLLGLPCADSEDICSRVDSRYDCIVDSIVSVSDAVLPKTCFRSYLKPYWDRTLKDLHAVMRGKRRKWISEGRHQGNHYLSYLEHKASKRNFRAHHRLCAENYLSEINDEIDQAAEVDSSFFWKKVNSRRQQSNSHAGSELKFANRVCRDPAEIVSEWGCYFRKLYSPNVSTNFDPLFKVSVDRRVHHIIEDFANSCQTNLTAFTPDEVSNAVRSLKRKKACGFDCIYNEHLIYGGNILHKELSLLFNDMYSCGYVPDRLKRGIIVTIHKGGKKSKTDPDNYRAVTLSSCILKLFERLLLHRAESALSIPLNSMQGGFRATLGCNMSSLMLRECVSFAKENHSKLFACFLDVQKAFDSVWHNGLSART
ncbi:MAG: reverse transcriptase domain-containing protein [Candidatus Thiodiazotropha endolucinida]|nr:hypothetical protein [Candidatus Thiodiazotropha taylori]MCW4264188.1 reverse transcriptase domain-containing protein [Candidatus Thiodiazotropha endolucinida]